MSKRGRFDSGHHHSRGRGGGGGGGGGGRSRTGFGGSGGAGFERLFVDDNPWAQLERRAGLPRLVGFIFNTGRGPVSSDNREVMASLEARRAQISAATDNMTDTVNASKEDVVREVERVDGDGDGDAENDKSDDDQDEDDEECAITDTRPE